MNEGEILILALGGIHPIYKYGINGKKGIGDRMQFHPIRVSFFRNMAPVHFCQVLVWISTSFRISSPIQRFIKNCSLPSCATNPNEPCNEIPFLSSHTLLILMYDFLFESQSMHFLVIPG